MRLVDAIPIASTFAPPAPTSSIEPLRATAQPDAEIIDRTILRRADQVELVARESSLPADFWARLAINNARQPAANPVPYWAALEQNRQAHDGLSNARAQAARPQHGASGCQCRTQAKAPYAGPSLSEVSPVKATAPSPQIKTIDVLRVHAPAGHIIDVFI